MFPLKRNPNTDTHSRSLIQKAVRRGDPKTTARAFDRLVAAGDTDWLRKRLAAITFEEAWPYGKFVDYPKDLEALKKHYVNVARRPKNRNAGALGVMGFLLSEGEDVLQHNDSDRDVEHIARAIKDPAWFWSWAFEQADTPEKLAFVKQAQAGNRKMSWPWDKAFAMAAAYQVLTDPASLETLNQEQLPPEDAGAPDASAPEIPLWVAIDKHTPEGRQALREAAKEQGIPYNTAAWLNFYFEGAQMHNLEKSPWLEREVAWRFNKLGLTPEQAREMWGKLKPAFQEKLTPFVTQLEERLPPVSKTAGT